MDQEHVYSSVRMPKHLHAKWGRLAEQLGTNRNQLLNRLIESTEVISQPAVNVSLNKNNRNTTNLAGTGEAVVSQ